MKNRKKKTKASKSSCMTILPFMFDYACNTDELTPARHKLIQEHLKSCPKCSKTAEDMKFTVSILRKASNTLNATPARLSTDRRQRIIKLCSAASRGPSC